MAKSTFGFPRELLMRPPEEREKYFKERSVIHPHFKKVLDEALYDINHLGRGSILFIYGPTGAGKSRLVETIKESMLSNFDFEMQGNLGKIPIASVEVPAPEYGKFSWKDFCKVALITLQEPLINQKVQHITKNVIGKDGNLTSRSRITTADLRLVLENAFIQRSVSTFILDDAQHLLTRRSEAEARDQMDVVKSLANRGETLLVLTGTYDLMKLVNQSDQLSHRAVNIHFPRYHLENHSDKNSFISTILAFQNELPLIKKPDLVSEWKFLYERSLGCIGILKKWLYMSLCSVHAEGQDTITREILEKTALSVKQCNVILKEAITGEKKAKETSEERDNLLRDLGLKGLEKSEPKKRSYNHSRKVGIRNPKRDPVGIPENLQVVNQVFNH